MPLDADLNDLRVFTQVVESQSFTAAGKRLQMPRSTVSRRVAQLEKHLGVRLLQRTTRSLQLTELGSSYYERCAAALSAIDEAEQLVKEAQATPRGKLRITAPHDLGEFLAPMVASFICAYPEVQISLELTQRMVDLVTEGFDMALRATSGLPDSSLVARRLAQSHGALYASERYLARAAALEVPEDLAQHRCIALGNKRPIVQWPLVHRDGRQQTVTVTPTISVNDPGFARDCAAADAGVAFIPTGSVDRPGRQNLVRVLPAWSFPESGGVYVVYPTAKHLSATVRALGDHLAAGFAALPWVSPRDPLTSA